MKLLYNDEEFFCTKPMKYIQTKNHRLFLIFVQLYLLDLLVSSQPLQLCFI